jgi:tRNA(Ile)-lysidine synthase
LLPLLETFNPRAAETIARAAGLLREESSALEGFAARLLEDARAESVESHGAWPLRVEVLNGAPAALRRRALRLWVARGRGGLRRISLANVSAVERLLKGERGGRVAELPGGARVERRKGLLTFRSPEGS